MGSKTFPSFLPSSCVATCFDLTPAHNVFALYISHYLTFALHSVGQGPVSLYNNFICAKGFPQHFNGPSPVHTSSPSGTVTRGAACYGYKPVTGASTARWLRHVRHQGAQDSKHSVQFVWAKQVEATSVSLTKPFSQTHYSQWEPSRFLHRRVCRLSGGNVKLLLRDTKLQTTVQSFVVTYKLETRSQTNCRGSLIMKPLRILINIWIKYI